MSAAAMRPLRVAHVVQGLDVGGLERQVLELVRRTDRRIAEPEIICTDYAGELAATVAPQVPLSVLNARRGLDWRAVVHLAQHFRRSHSDIVHSHNQRAHYLSTLAACAARVPVLINTRHGLYAPSTRRAILRRRTLAALSQAIVAVSASARDEARRTDHIPEALVRTIANGTDIGATHLERGAARAVLGLQQNDFVVGAVGRLAPEKDYAGLIDAVTRLRSQLPNLAVAILGGGPLADILAANAREQSCNEVRFYGYRTDAVALLPAFDLFVQPSLSEGIPLAVIEAMAAGVAVIATAVGGNPEALDDGAAGVLVPARDPEALASAIVALAGDVDRRTELVAAARRRVATHFSIDATARAYEALYLEQARRRGLDV